MALGSLFFLSAAPGGLLLLLLVLTSYGILEAPNRLAKSRPYLRKTGSTKEKKDDDQNDDELGRPQFEWHALLPPFLDLGLIIYQDPGQGNRGSPALAQRAPYISGSAYRIRTGDLLLEREVSWAARRMRHPGWGPRIRTSPCRSRVCCPTARRVPNGIYFSRGKRGQSRAQ